MNSLNLRVSSKVEENVKKNSDLRTSPMELPTNCLNIKIYDNFGQDFANVNNVAEQVHIVNKIFPLIEENDEALFLFTEIYFNAPLKHPVRNQITKNLLKSDPIRVVEFLSRSLENLIHGKPIGNRSSENLNQVVTSISGCFDNFRPGLKALEIHLNSTFKFLYLSTENYLEQIDQTTSPSLRNEYYLFVHNSIRLKLSIIQEFDAKLLEHQVENLKKLQVIAYRIICDQEIPMDIKTNCGILSSYVSKLFDDFENFIQRVRSPKNVWEISLCIGAINTLDGDTFDKYYIDYSEIVKCISEIAKEHCTIPNILLTASRSLFQISKMLSSFKVHNDVLIYIKLILNTLLAHSCAYLEHHMDSVRHICKDTFSNVVRLAEKLRLDEVLSGLFNECNSESSLSMKCVLLLQMTNVLGTKVIMENVPALFRQIFPAQLGRDWQVNKLFEVLMVHNFKEVDFDIWKKTWIGYLLDIAYKKDSRLVDVETLIEKGSKIDPRITLYIIEDVPNISIRTKLAVLRTSRNNNNRNLLNNFVEHFKLALMSSCDETKIMGLKLLVESQKTTELFSEFDLEHILLFIKYNSNCQSPATRQNMMGLLEKALIRFALNLSKTLKTRTNNELYEKFVKDLIEVLILNLFEGANFTRRSVSLQLLEKCIYILVNCNLRISDFLPENATQILIARLSDSYESNRKIAVSILNLIGKTEHIIKLSDIESLITSIKPAESVTAAYTLEYFCGVSDIQEFQINECEITSYNGIYYAAIKWVLNILKKGIHLAHTSILLAAAKNPLYGALFAIHHLLNKLDFQIMSDDELWRVLIAELIVICKSLNDVVGPIVNNSSPEGHLPNDLGEIQETLENDSNIKISSQLVLVCAWRTVKEVSLILGEIVAKSPIKSNIYGKYIVTKPQVIEIGEHFKELLLETKHRGACEQAYVGFSMLCKRFWRVSDEEIHTLPMKWLTDLIAIISKDEKINEKICATRRSAGIPFIVQALTISELQVGTTKGLNYCMQKLLDLCADKERSSESRTHALNILRVLFRCADLNESIIEFIGSGVKCAIEGYEANTWSEKNSSTLLFSALITRMFGVQRTKDSDTLNIRNRMTGRIFFLRYPLYDYFLNELRKASELVLLDQKANKLHPLLLILSRLYPSALEGTESNLKLSDFIPYISIASGCPEMHTRILAAKSVVALVSIDSTENEILGKCSLIRSEKWISLNLLHGFLLQISGLLKSMNKVRINVSKDIISTLNLLIETNTNAVILQTVLDIFIVLLKCEQISTTALSTISTRLNMLLPEFSFYYPVLRKSLCIFNLYSIRLTNSAELCNFLVSKLKERSSLEQIETVLNVLLLIMLTDDLSQEFECSKEEIEFLNTLSEECVAQLKKELIRNKELRSTLDLIIETKICYPECTTKVYAIFSQLNEFNVGNFIANVKALSETIKYSVAISLKNDLRNGKAHSVQAVLDFLMDASQLWQKDSLRIQAASIVRHIYPNYLDFLKSEDRASTKDFIYILLDFLLDDDSDIRERISKIIVSTNNLLIDNIISTYALELFIKITALKLDELKCSQDFKLYVTNLFMDYGVNMNNTDDGDDGLEIFEKNDANVFAEPMLVGIVCKKIMPRTN